MKIFLFVQILYLIYFAIVRPYETLIDNLNEILNEFMLDVFVVILKHDLFQVGPCHLLTSGLHSQLLAEVPGNVPVFFGSLRPPCWVIFNLFPRYSLATVVINLGALRPKARTD